ncbi:hypothetical protein BHC43_00290 [Snodgrassella alvi]|uniref:hypothetical protein n=1 Tax=Snodgrassella alvi TaxID=1196083 RepID=UPI000C1E9E78|nr:hypothetical protein [Snodgrassella alvi]PIT41847.1 hypothetical protein BHC43_00290 [Snodgrassella alvi]
MSAEKIMQAIAVTAELTGTQLSDNAMAVMAEDLLAYPLDKVLIAFERCRRELKGKLTLAAILERIDDGWQSAEEAFNALVSGWENDSISILTTHTAMQAAQSATALFNAGDKYRAGMAFKTAYERMVSEKKAKGMQPDWFVSAGVDKEQLAHVVKEATMKGLITQDYALTLLPASQERIDIETGNLLTNEQRATGKEKLGNLINLIAHKCAMS